MDTVHSIISDQIIKQLEKGVIPWRKAWGGAANEPKNLISGKEYSGINFFLLSMMNMQSPYFLTFKQAKLCGGNVKKGERGFPIIFFKVKPKEKNLAGQTVKDGYAMLRYYTVFNLSQCENIKPEKMPVVNEIGKLEFNPIEEAEKIVSGYMGKPRIVNRENQPSYTPVVDVVNMPLAENFTDREEYYSTLFHEFIHSTGHQKRLNRPELMEKNCYGSIDYSKEELVAEMGAAFLCSKAGIDNTLENSAAYIQGFLRKLKSQNNQKWIVEAGSKAQKAVNYIYSLDR